MTEAIGWLVIAIAALGTLDVIDVAVCIRPHVEGTQLVCVAERRAPTHGQ